MKKLMCCIILSILGCSLFAEEHRNCSTFMLKADSVLLVGHNLDESPELHVPGMVCINKRNEYREGITWHELIASPPDYEKVLVPFQDKPSPKIRWISKYGSLTFNSEGIDFPDGGINEKGLVVFEMSLRDTRYKVDESNPTLFMPLWIQYQLDNCTSLDEVIKNANDMNLQGWSWHYFVTDGNGGCAIIEFLNGEVIVHENEHAPYPVLCNTQYSRELERLIKYRERNGIFSKALHLLKKPPRFVRAANMLDEYDPSVHTSPVEYGLSLLDEIQIKGWNKWSILVDVRNMMVYFHTNRNRKLRSVSLDSLDFSAQPAQVLDIHADISGDVTSDLSDYTSEINHELTSERAELLFVDRFRGLIENGVTARGYAERFAGYSERMRRNKPE